MRIIEQTKESYYETLQKSSQGWHEGKHHALPWVEYALSRILAAYTEFRNSRVLYAGNPGKGSKTDIVMNAIDGFIGDLTVSNLEKTCPNVSVDMIRNILKKLKKEERVASLR